MSIKLIYSIFDSASSIYSSFFFCVAEGEAKRAFSDESNNPSKPIGQHPEDFALMYMGTFDDSSGEFLPVHPPRSLGLAISYKKV